jgi:hypothetical protein
MHDAHFAMHEGSHLALGHEGTKASISQREFVARFLPDLDPDSVTVLARTTFHEEKELHAETFASVLATEFTRPGARLLADRGTVDDDALQTLFKVNSPLRRDR